jgi:spermidine synthase
MDSLKPGWFSEFSTLWAGQAFSIAVDKILHQERSQYQDILVLQTPAYGRVLVLDGVIQCTERDEFSYQEMMTFVPLCSHPNPRNVLIIGGGDGGVAREVAKYPTVETIVQCEIDERVVELSKQWLPFMASGFESPKLQLHIGDGLEFMKQHEAMFDVIITDSSDPVGPAETLFQESYYQLAAKALKPNGILCSQGENMWYHAPLITDMLAFCSKIFPKTRYGYTCIPTYPGGQIGLLVCSKNPDTEFQTPARVLSKEELSEMNLRYYTPKIHSAAFTLPRFMTELIKKGAKKT